MLPECDRQFTATLHNMDVKLFCQDALHLAQLMKEIARCYGDILFVIHHAARVDLFS